MCLPLHSPPPFLPAPPTSQQAAAPSASSPQKAHQLWGGAVVSHPGRLVPLHCHHVLQQGLSDPLPLAALMDIEVEHTLGIKLTEIALRLRETCHVRVRDMVKWGFLFCRAGGEEGVLTVRTNSFLDPTLMAPSTTVPWLWRMA
jgi:hypothetical protein